MGPLPPVNRLPLAAYVVSCAVVAAHWFGGAPLTVAGLVDAATRTAVFAAVMGTVLLALEAARHWLAGG